MTGSLVLERLGSEEKERKRDNVCARARISIRIKADRRGLVVLFP